MTNNPETAGVEPVVMTADELRLEDLKQIAAYSGPVISFDVRDGFYLASCDHCGWVGSSHLCGTDSGGDDSDVYCPRCCASGADCGKVAERVPAPASNTTSEGEGLDPDIKRRLESVCQSLTSAGSAGLPIGFHQLAHDIRATLAAIRSGSE